MRRKGNRNNLNNLQKRIIRLGMQRRYEKNAAYKRAWYKLTHNLKFNCYKNVATTE